ncbi:MAG: twin-arginine translocase TatA/TatE family subunit, partial [Spirochaetes bacterium]
MLGGIGVQEILVILVVGLLVFGASRLPKIA